MKKDDLGNRMKGYYESRSQAYLNRRTPVIIRLDGKAFHSYTKNFPKPYSETLRRMMNLTAIQLCKEIQGAKLAYVQSDEISILVTDYDKFTTEAWFDYNVQKMCSVSASIAAAYFNHFYLSTSIEEHAQEISDSSDEGRLKYLVDLLLHQRFAVFDSRCFNLSKEEVSNYFLWRFKDWERNSIQMLAQSLYSHKELHGKNKQDLHEMCFQKGKNWADLEPAWKNGSFIIKQGDWGIQNEINLNEDRSFIEEIVNYGQE